jgi:hypothetical protein
MEDYGPSSWDEGYILYVETDPDNSGDMHEFYLNDEKEHMITEPVEPVEPVDGFADIVQNIDSVDKMDLLSTHNNHFVNTLQEQFENYYGTIWKLGDESRNNEIDRKTNKWWVRKIEEHCEEFRATSSEIYQERKSKIAENITNPMSLTETKTNRWNKHRTELLRVRFHKSPYIWCKNVAAHKVLGPNKIYPDSPETVLRGNLPTRFEYVWNLVNIFCKQHQFCTTTPCPINQHTCFSYRMFLAHLVKTSHDDKKCPSTKCRWEEMNIIYKSILRKHKQYCRSNCAYPGCNNCCILQWV